MGRKKKGRKQKPRSYFMRFNPKMRRRRQCKTDYQARASLVTQDKNKYNTPKYRLVVRKTNKDILCQIVSSQIIGDFVHCVAYSHELPRYGLEVGLTNYAACYATGLLCARRMLKKMGLDEEYEGNAEPDGEYFNEEAGEGDDMSVDEKEDSSTASPFYCILDVGLNPTTCGARVFACLKGAVDGGISMPQGGEGKKYPGFSMMEGSPSFDASVTRKYIFGGHVGDYMTHLQENDEERYQSHFAEYIKRGITAEDLEEMYAKVHAAIRENPEADTSKKAAKAQKKESAKNKEFESKYVSRTRKTRAQRRDHVYNKILAIRKKAGL